MCRHCRQAGEGEQFEGGGGQLGPGCFVPGPHPRQGESGRAAAAGDHSNLEESWRKRSTSRHYNERSKSTLAREQRLGEKFVSSAVKRSDCGGKEAHPVLVCGAGAAGCYERPPIQLALGSCEAEAPQAALI